MLGTLSSLALAAKNNTSKRKEKKINTINLASKIEAEIGKPINLGKYTGMINPTILGSIKTGKKDHSELKMNKISKKKEDVNISGDTNETYFLPEHYELYKNTMNKNIFEEVIDRMMVESYMDQTFEPFKDKIKLILEKDIPHENKRFAILCTLDNNRQLMRKAKIFKDKKLDSIFKLECEDIDGLFNDISMWEHIQNYIKILRDYVKVSDVEKKKFGEVMTPHELVIEMLSKLPKEVWSNPDLKWLDPCNGVGPFGAVVVGLLMKGLKKWEPDHNKRYKHILENMIYVCELQPKNMFLWMCMMDPKNEYNLNVYCGSFLESGFDLHMKEVWGLDKFDIVVGNPPYQMAVSKTHKLWVYFLDKAHDMSDILLFVNPTLLCDGRSKNIKDIRNKILKNLSYINFANKGIFNIGEEVCYYLLDKSKKVKETRVTLLDKSEVFREYDDIIYEDDIQQVINSIIDKISSKQPKINWYSDIKNTDGNGAPKSLLKTGLFSEVEDEIFKFKVHHSASNTLWCSEKKSSGLLKLIFNFSGGYYDINDPNRYMFISDGIVGKQMESILINSIEDGNKLKKIYSSKIFRFFIENEKTGGFNTGLFKLPLLSSDIECTDEKLFEYFGLTEEEKNIILNR